MLSPGEYIEQSFEDVDFSGSELRGVRLVRCSLRRSQLTEVTTYGCQFTDCNFSNARLNGSTHKGSSFTNCSFMNTNLFAARFEDCKLTGSRFRGSDFTNLTVTGGDWSWVNFRLENLEGVQLQKVKLVETDFYDSILKNADLSGSILTRANLDHALLEGCDLRGADLDGVAFDNVNLRGARLDVAGAIRFAQAHGAIVE